MNGVSERLRAVRQCFGMNQIEMSAHLGLGKNSWQRYEIEGKLPKGETLAKLAQAGFSGHWLLTGQGPMRTAEQAAFAASAQRRRHPPPSTPS